ncbi:hypothetical protein L6452_31564 [Arctium lappa]|uniref:Uncharacterized protein n=1 Tax=Arctium lappa TaxID=4217 RepID=A0ACB8Z1E2_ARCLA|nr:hypothetical protein L6452_31564 [Arctium lappa]
MEGFQKAAIRSGSTGIVTKEPSSATNLSFNQTPPSDPAVASLVLTRPPCRRAVSLLTCSKLCGFCFVAGIIVGYTLKQRRLRSPLFSKIQG